MAERLQVAESRRVLEELPSISASVLKNRMGDALSMAGGGGVAITRHQRTEFVLLTAAKYLELQRARQVPLEALADQFDKMVEKMNTRRAKKGVVDLFSATPPELGSSAVKAARNDGR